VRRLALLLVAVVGLAALTLPDAAAAKECNSYRDYYAPLTASERVPCRSARRVMRRCDASDAVGRMWNCRVREQTWRCRVTGMDDDGISTA
jgi:hypothetical protein